MSARHRSRSHPVSSLAEAEDAVHRLSDRFGERSFDDVELAKAAGFSGSAGITQRQISALKQYGWITSHNGANKLTDLALELTRTKSPTDRRSLLRLSLQNVKIFYEFAQSLEREDTQPDYLGLLGIATKIGIQEQAAPVFLDVFFKSREHAQVSRNGHPASAFARPAVFVGSSREGHRIAQGIQLLLDHVAEVEIWSQGVFGLSESTLESLVSQMTRYDFAVLALTADDLTSTREKTHPAARDNVVFELGLCMGVLGRDRTFIVYDRSNRPDLPSDLAGVTAATYEPHRTGNIEATLGAPCTRIQQQIESLGRRKR